MTGAAQRGDAPLLRGAPGSPYTRKMLAYLRYRGIPYRLLPPPLHELEQLWVQPGAAPTPVPGTRVSLLPTFYFPQPDGSLEAMLDSTFLIRRLERDYPEAPQVIPPDPALAMVDALLEDYADEWLTKAMFHFRWVFQDDIDKASKVLPRWRGFTAPQQVLEQMEVMFRERQISRLYVVGSNEETAGWIEDSYREFLDLFDGHLAAGRPYVLGDRPAACDFALFGQLTQLAGFDPTPMAETLRRAPRVFSWVEVTDDLSGWSLGDAEGGSWMAWEQAGERLRPWLAHLARGYVPVMLANAAAQGAGQEEFSVQLDGVRWSQRTFPYQVKCLQDLRGLRAGLEQGDRARFDELLAGTGCEALFQDG